MHALVVALALAGTAAVTPALAQTNAYLDDRSSAAALIRSYYDAVNRREYARAWAYFGEDKPAASLEAFAQGFETTQRVDVATGPESVEGAAGSTFYAIPVAIRATATDGSETVYAGCYTARLADPRVQGEAFQPLHLVDGSLAASDLPLEEAVPAQCGDAPPVSAQDALLRQAAALFAATHADDCTGMPFGDERPAPDVHVIDYRPAYAEADAPLSQATLVRFFCGAGAYNELHVYYLDTELDGLREISFAQPELDIRYENDDIEAAVTEMRIIGYTAEHRLVNSDYSPQDYTISAVAKWRGIGDASSAGLWLFRDGNFTLVRYEVDATYDGEINPEPVLDFYSAP
jgi:hypothetical protein